MSAVTLAPYRDTARCLCCGRRFERQRASRLTCSDVCRQARSRALRAATPPLPNGKCDLIYADPPWQFRDWTWGGSGGRRLPYMAMDLPALCRLPIAAAAAPEAQADRDPDRAAPAWRIFGAVVAEARSR